MASIIPGYEYDIFISYRQKDNKYDGWVTEFVENLKKELEATFKEDISIYFDANPIDGLLETHIVDESLAKKLKCLLFIPVISQTYCDPQSFAWQHEFKAFVEQASQDRFGLKVKLPGGNVASRVLPVRIHDLDINDIKLCESIIGGVLRGVDFIYKSAGVNRPLRSKEDNPHDNLNHTNYRDQINKVANAIKEIILGLKTIPITQVEEKTLHKELLEEIKKEERSNEQVKLTKLTKRKLLSGSIIIIAVVIVIVLFYPKIFNRDKFNNLKDPNGRISVAVMPFQNMTNDTTWNVWQDGIQINLITSLSNSEELKVRRIESINGLLQSKGLTNYASITPSVASTISQKLDANVFIQGSINQGGSKIRVNAQLIDSKTEESFKSFLKDGTAENILHIIDSLSVMIKNYLIISILNKEVTPDIQQLVSTNSPEAFKYFIHGNNSFAKRDNTTATTWYLQALKSDSGFVAAIFWLSMAYWNQGLYKEGKKLCLKAYEKRDQMPMLEKNIVNYTHACYFETPYEEIKYLKQIIDIDEQLPDFYHDLGEDYEFLHQYDKAISVLEKVLEIYKKWGSKPESAEKYTLLGHVYHKNGQYKKEGKLYKKAEQDFPDDPELIYRQAVLSLTEGDTVAANRYIEKYISVCKDNSDPEANIITNLASVYSESGILNKAEGYYRKALSLEPEKPDRLKNLAYFLIDKDRNINEGLELIDKALNLKPDNYDYLDNKGLGLYKQGKYQEALDILQKSWDLRREKAVYEHEAFLHLDAAKKAVANQK
jgi:tetratricopeptide (TPR) repeat protein/TolB-like protein